ncbi:MAG TPA: Asp-tRNA(Asn)/Glu-tRNA(Gln) amidotransferase subunit GatC [Candidatus Saccharimonadia bacterium]|nr:Asp-tRNA(Asn)/Glu-tRNA(Gln) amidotransferase subunit GatC [Candidatus Saccharimonadia bacterium]
MSSSLVITTALVRHMALLANIPISADEEKKLADGFTATMKVVNQLNELNVTGVEPTHQVTGLTNVLREDVVDEDQMFTQEQALMNAKQTHNGFIVVDQILDQG